MISCAASTYVDLKAVAHFGNDQLLDLVVYIVMEVVIVSNLGRSKMPQILA